MSVLDLNSAKLAFVFPGQGSQSVGMLSELAKQHVVINDTFKQASEVLNYDLWQLVQEDPDGRLNQTQYTQPALLAAGVAMWRLWCERHGQRPIYMAGHSLGEYTALVCSGALTFKAGIAIVAERGRLMQSAVAVGEGAMAAIIGLSDEKIKKLCDENASDEVLSPANFNAIGQIVVAGHASAVERLMKAAKVAGAKRAQLIPVSIPSHCALMKPAAEELKRQLAHYKFQAPKIPIVHNVDVKMHQSESEIKEALIKQLDHPVRWVETIQFFAHNHINAFVECGPGRVLAGLNKRIVRGIPTINEVVTN